MSTRTQPTHKDPLIQLFYLILWAYLYCYHATGTEVVVCGVRVCGMYVCVCGVRVCGMYVCVCGVRVNV
jgi:hypothetical protein